ncbi:MAG: polysaccharide deacetylase family protein [Candidatus Paceibacterota bacterium]
MRQMLRQVAWHAANSPPFGVALSMLDRVTVCKRNVLAVVTYHRVDDASRTPYLYPGLISATPQQFIEQLDLLMEMGNIVSLQQVLEARRGQTVLPARSILITFDDACQDFADYAWPALRERQLPVTVFVPTAYPNHPQLRFWWDRLHVAVWHGRLTHLDTPCGTFQLDSRDGRERAMRTLREYVKRLEHESAMKLIEDICIQQKVSPPPPSVLGWDQLRTLAREGVTLAPHTQTHPLLTQVSIETARQEVTGSREHLKREIGDALPVLAYPGGAHDQSLIEMLRQEGFELAFSVRRGVNDLSTADPYSLKRINVGGRTTLSILRAQLIAGWWKHRGGE